MAIWTILYLPTGLVNGFVAIALTFFATQKGLTITQGSLLVGAQAFVSWMKWLWAPLVDVSLTPMRWYLLATISAALGMWALTVISLDAKNLTMLLVIVAITNFFSSISGMAVESLISRLIPQNKIGPVSGWFQAGYLIGTGVSGVLALYLLRELAESWICGIVFAGLAVSCCLALWPLRGRAQAGVEPAVNSLRSVLHEFWAMIQGRFGFLTASLCLLPIAVGAAQVTLTQSAVAEFWGAGAREVGFVQGILAALMSTLGSFLVGRFFNSRKAHAAYLVSGILLVLVTLFMAVSPHTVFMYVTWNLIYSLALGVSYAAFTGMVLMAIGPGMASTGYNIFASLGNFPFWWVGLLLGWIADHLGPRTMLLTESALGIAGLGVYCFLVRRWRVM